MNSAGPAPATPGSAAASSPAESPNAAGSSDSNSAQASSGSATSNAPANPDPSNPTAASGAAPNNAAPKAVPSGNASPVNCPPSKTLVRDGGITEQVIQLVGGKNAEQNSAQRSTTDQLLGSTEDNLKKVSGRQLSSSQLEMVNQIQQFLQQSKAAVSAGDVERGHTLAVKAHLLSDELVKP